jgi:hypothetical protein
LRARLDGFEDFEGEFAAAKGAGFIFDSADERLGNAAALMGGEDVEVVIIDHWARGEVAGGRVGPSRLR